MSVAQVGAECSALVSPDHCDQYPAIAHLSLSESVKCHDCISIGEKGTFGHIPTQIMQVLKYIYLVVMCHQSPEDW